MQGLSENTQVVLLLCGVFGGDVRQLSTGEYNKLAMGLKDLQLQPVDLIQNNACIKEAAQNVGIDDGRLAKLMGRGVQLSHTIEAWSRNGVWVVSRSDEDYPQRIKDHLRAKAPPIIHGIGDRSFLKGGGLAVVGSRNVDRQGEDFTRKVGEICAAAGEPVVSGGARGVDQIAMSSAIEAGGAAVGILAEKLLRKSLDREARHAISDGRLLLISPYHPDARFTVGNAMGRNKLIYAMAEYALVVSAEHRKGGTWAGAEEELKHNNPRPVFVRTGSGIPKGNSELLKKDCAFPWPDHADKDNLWQQLESTSKGEATITLAGEGEQGTMDFGVTSTPATSTPVTLEDESTHIPGSAYQALLPIILDMLPNTRKEISKHLNIVDAAIKEWLDKAIDEGKVSKSGKSPVLYHNKQEALPLEEQASPKIDDNIQEQIYRALLPLILHNCKTEIKSNDLAKALGITKGKLFNKCIDNAINENQIEKLNKPVRYKASTYITLICR